MDIDQAEMCPGTTGLLIDETPPLTTAHVRPFVWAVLLYRGAASVHEVVHAVSAICGTEDLKIANWDEADEEEERSWAEYCAEKVLGEMVAEGLCRYNWDKDIWVLDVGANKRNVPTVIAAVSTLNARMPQHFLLDMER